MLLTKPPIMRAPQPNETLSANLVYQSDYEIGSTTPSDEAMMKIMMMVMIKCLNLEKKKEKNKRLKAKV